MKKRNLFVALVMSLVMLFTGCSNESNPFVGKWNGTLDLTEHFEQSTVSVNASLEKYAEFENLTLNYVFEFTEDTVSLRLDASSTEQFITNVENGVANMIDAMAEDVAAENNVTAEDVFAGMGVTRDGYVQSIIDSMKIEDMIHAMAEEIDLSGTYQYDGEKITVFYEGNTYEQMEYAFDGDQLSITTSDGTNAFVINCIKEAD